MFTQATYNTPSVDRTTTTIVAILLLFSNHANVPIHSLLNTSNRWPKPKHQSCTIAMFKTGHWLMADAIANTRIVPEVHMGVTRACSSESWLIQCRRKDNTPQ
jgi:hypothetical protein